MNEEIALSYVKKRKRRKRAAIISGISSLGITVFLIIAFCLIYVDRFTITTSSSELSLTIDENHETMTTQLVAPPLLKATDTQYTDIPTDIDDGLGSKNHNDGKVAYFAYSFQLYATCEAPSLNYGLTMMLQRKSNDLEQAIKILIIRNGVKTIYAKSYSEKQAENRNDPTVGTDQLPYLGQDVHEGDTKNIYSGERIPGQAPEKIDSTVPFEDNPKHIIYKLYSIVSGEYDKYTIVIWIDGWESDNSMKSGEFQAELKFSAESYNNQGEN